MIERKNILLVGDLVLDTYTFGSVKRISPEAPVPVLLTERSENRPGMAGNVALNLSALGQNVRLLSRIGVGSGALLEALESLDTSHLVVQEDYTTPIKNRLSAHRSPPTSKSRSSTHCPLFWRTLIFVLSATMARAFSLLLCCAHSLPPVVTGGFPLALTPRGASLIPIAGRR